MSPSLLSRGDAHPYDRLTPDVIIAAVESLGYVSDRRILALNSYENRVYQVGLEGGTPLVAKFYRPQRSSAAAGAGPSSARAPSASGWAASSAAFIWSAGGSAFAIAAASTSSGSGRI